MVEVAGITRVVQGRDSAAAPTQTVHRTDLGLAMLAELANWIAFVVDRK